MRKDQLGRTALRLAVSHRHESVIQELLNIPSDLEIQDSRALHVAVATNQERAGVDLLAAGSDPEWKDSAQRAALHLATLKGSDTILRSLVETGAYLHARIQ